MVIYKTIFFSIAILLSTCLHAQAILTKDQVEVQQTVDRFFNALSSRDSVSLKQYCTSDIALYEYGTAWNIDTLILKAITLNTATDYTRTNKFDFIRTTINGHTAWTTYYLQSDISKNGKQATVQWMETVVAVKDNDRWKIKVLHSSLIKRN